MAQRQTNDSTKEMGTADFTNIIASVKNEDAFKSFQMENQNALRTIMDESNALQTDRVCYAMQEMDDENNSFVNSSICGDYVKNRLHKRHRREISVTDVMPVKHKNDVLNKSDIQITVTEDNDFLMFTKKFRITMRSLIFIQYFTVTELIKLKLVHSQLNHIINQKTIEMAIQIGNLDEIERELYWKSFANISIENLYKMIPSSMIDTIKQNKKSNINMMDKIKWKLESSLPEIYSQDTDMVIKIIGSLFKNQHLHRIFEPTPE